MILQINKNYFKDLPKGEHNIKIRFTDGEAKETFVMEDEIVFYIHQEEQFPFTATKNMTWADWIMSYGVGTSGNNILWVGFDNKTLYIDPRSDHLGDFYSDQSLGSSTLEFMNMDTLEKPGLGDIIEPNGIYGCSICCFDAGTKITMADYSLKNIEDIVVGDEIISYNENTKEFEIDKVTNTIIKENSDDLVFIKLSNGAQIGMRAYHPLLTKDGWKSLRPHLAETLKDMHQEVLELTVGDSLIGIKDCPTIVEIIKRETPANYNTYNFTVENNHNYIANNIVAHNAGCR